MDDVPETRLEINPRTGNYEIRWTDRDESGRARTRTYSCRTPDRALAEQVRQTWLTAAQHVVILDLAHSVASLIDNYDVGRICPAGISEAQRWALRPVRAFLGNDMVGDLTHARLEQYRRHRAKKVVDATIRRELGALRAVLGWALKAGILPAGTVLPHIALPPASQPRENYLEADEEARMWGLASALATDPGLPFRQRRIGLYVCLALETAARAAAIEGLEWSRVDLIRGVIDFREPGRRVTRKRRVPIPVSDRLRPILEDAAARRGQVPDGPKYVLGHPGSTRKAFEAFAEKGGFDCTRHDLRRTWATLRAQRGVPLFHVAGVLGDDVETVTRHYAHHSPEHLRQAVNG